MTRAKLWKYGAVAGGLIAAALVLWVAYIGFATWVLGSSCRYKTVDEKQSAAAALKAAIIDYDCGASTSFHTFVVIAPIGQKFDYARDLVASFRGQARSLAWEGSKLVVYYADAEPTTTVSLFNRTPIEYRGEGPQTEPVHELPWDETKLPAP